MPFELTESGNIWTINQGETTVLTVNYKNTAGSTVSLSSGYTARMMGRATHDASATIFSLTSSSGITLAGSDPNITITIAATATDDFDAPSSGVYDLELVTTASGVVERILEGAFKVTPEVTR